MAADAPASLLAVGGVRTVEKRVNQPVLYEFPGSFNSGKACLAMQISQKGRECIIKEISHMRDNYTPEYARLNPDTMAVPTMEIDDKVCTESLDGVKYLMNHYPGPGDQEVVDKGRLQEMMDWVESANAWDEYMYTYGSQSLSTVDMLNSVRLIYLRINLNKVLTEKPADLDFLVDRYVNKIAGVTIMNRAMVDNPNKEKDLRENHALLDRLMAKASELLGDSSGFLFSDKLTTGDVVFLPIFRIFHVATPANFEEVFKKHPNLRGYWERAKAHPDVEMGMMKYVAKRYLACAVLTLGIPKSLLLFKLGCLRAPEIPEDVESRIAESIEAKWKAARPS